MKQAQVFRTPQTPTDQALVTFELVEDPGSVVESSLVHSQAEVHRMRSLVVIELCYYLDQRITKSIDPRYSTYPQELTSHTSLREAQEHGWSDVPISGRRVLGRIEQLETPKEA